MQTASAQIGNPADLSSRLVDAIVGGHLVCDKGKKAGSGVKKRAEVGQK